MAALLPPVVPAGFLASTPQPTLAADGLTLRPWRAGDAPYLVEAYEDETIRRWHVRSMSDPEAHAWINGRAARWAAETGADWAVTEHGVPVGRLGLKQLDLVDGAAEVAYWVLPAARGRAVAPRAVAALTRWCFTDLGLHRLEILHSTANEASCRVAAKAGFAYEGTKRQEGLHADGWHDMHLHARLHDD
ncbi:MAG TPA: GNAT family N-acetyltransferase [Actinocatenispora sp.]